MQYKDILRSQVVFLDSALDLFMREVTKYGMVQIFQGIWEKTERYDNFTFYDKLVIKSTYPVAGKKACCYEIHLKKLSETAKVWAESMEFL